MGVGKQGSNFRWQPIGVATEELRNHTATDHSPQPLLLSVLFLWKIGL